MTLKYHTIQSCNISKKLQKQINREAKQKWDGSAAKTIRVILEDYFKEKEKKK